MLVLRYAGRSEGVKQIERIKNDKNENVKHGPRDLEIRDRSVRFTPKGFAKKELHRNIGFSATRRLEAEK